MIDKPTPPGDYDCCESGCEPCVWDTYNEKMAKWREAQKAQEQAEAASESTSPDQEQPRA